MLTLEPYIQPFTQQDLDEARSLYPEEKLASRALERFAQGNWDKHGDKFFWKDNERYICGPDIAYHDTKLPNYEEEWWGKDCYIVATDDRRPLPYVDGPKHNSSLVAHKSEKQWMLPRTHPHHLLNFPQEILDIIFDFTLVIKDHTITPDVTSSNSARSYKVSHSYTLDGKRYTPPRCYTQQELGDQLPLSTIITEKHYDTEGIYFMLRKVYRPIIDATILRVCKSIRAQATKMLYGENVFQFSMTHTGKNSFPGFLSCGGLYMGFPTRKLDARYRSYRQFRVGSPYPYAQSAIQGIENQVPMFGLEDHIYHDHFARFLRAIGPAKAAMITKLHFRGKLMIHECPDTCDANCEEDLIESLVFYIPLINKFCTSLHTLIIDVGDDQQYLRAHSDITPEERDFKAFGRFNELDKYFKSLETVRNLEVYHLKYDGPNRSGDSVDREDYDWSELRREKLMIAEKIIAWIKKRADGWLHEEIEMQKAANSTGDMTISHQEG
ncbi:hypothetical protein EAF04_010369 [Stromatinia cepivora]|nr:hypothetical protein EAF04_010369 [Stromatinia cepivora]